jgi:hypothetical protein
MARISQRLRLSSLYAGATIVISFAFNSTGAAADCSLTQQIEINVREPVSEMSQYGVVRGNAEKAALSAAIREGVGAVIRSRTQVSLEQLDDAVTERLLDLTLARSEGRVSAFRVTEEVLEQEGEHRFLRLSIEATVCAPSEQAIPAILQVASVQGPYGEVREDLRPILVSALPAALPLVIVDDSSGRYYHDLVVTGRILSARSVVVDNSERINLVTRVSGPQVAALIPRTARRVTVVGHVQATDPMSRESRGETVELHRNLTATADDSQAIEELIRETLAGAAGKLYHRVASEQE